MHEDISPTDAASKFGVKTRHQLMDNGERRFRLLKDDGTAYIRTEAGSTGAWQNSHYHASVRETYIVQQGWIAYAEQVSGTRRLSKYEADELFTTREGVVHNVYMPAHAVVHTVKHGHPAAEDRIVNDATRSFDMATQSLSEEQVLREVQGRAQAAGTPPPTETYSAEYRHFDSMIWQVPAWSTALFLVTAAGSNSINSSGVLQTATTLTPDQLAVGFFGLMFFVLACLSQVLYRFRKHQFALKRYPATPAWSSAQTYLQLVITVEAAALLFVLLLLLGLSKAWAGVVCVIIGAAMTYWRERHVRLPRSAPGAAI